MYGNLVYKVSDIFIYWNKLYSCFGKMCNFGELKGGDVDLALAESHHCYPICHNPVAFYQNAQYFVWVCLQDVVVFLQSLNRFDWRFCNRQYKKTSNEHIVKTAFHVTFLVQMAMRPVFFSKISLYLAGRLVYHLPILTQKIAQFG